MADSMEDMKINEDYIVFEFSKDSDEGSSEEGNEESMGERVEDYVEVLEEVEALDDDNKADVQNAILSTSVQQLIVKKEMQQQKQHRINKNATVPVVEYFIYDDEEYAEDGEAQTTVVETILPDDDYVLTSQQEKPAKEEVETKPDTVYPKPNVRKLSKGPKRYLLYDDLIANVVDYDPNDETPIVEFSTVDRDSQGKLPVECGICPDVMPKKKLSDHLKTHLVPGTNQYSCIYCSKVYKERNYLAGHARRHMGIRPYVCELCKLYFSTKQDLRVHNQRRHQEKEYTCELCGKTFSQNTMLKRHRESTHEKLRRFQCAHCPKGYYKNFSLKEHLRNVHQGERRMLECPFCGMQCRDAHKMARHRKMLHLNQKSFKCDICQEEFTDINYFDAHKRSIQCRNNTQRRQLELKSELLLQQQQQQAEETVNEEEIETTVESMQQVGSYDDGYIYEIELDSEGNH